MDLSFLKTVSQVTAGQGAGVHDLLDTIDVKKTESTILDITNKYIDAGENSRREIIKLFDENKLYYTGKKEEGIVDNRIFLSVETIIPIATSTPPVPNVLPAQNTIESIQVARQWEKVLLKIYNESGFQRKMEKSVRHLLLGQVSFFKVFIDEGEEEDDMEIKIRVVHPKHVLFDNTGDIDEGLSWVGELVTDTAAEMITKFPKKENEINGWVKNKLETKITYYEIWTDDSVVWRYNKTILKAMPNPYYDFKNKNNNFTKKPRHCYFPINMFDLGETVTGVTSLIEQAKTLQDNINKRKNQISKNADIVNGKIFASGANGMKKEEVAAIDWSDPSEGIFSQQGEANDIQRINGSPLPQFVESDMIHSQSEIDNLMGTHSTTRGEREGRETATGRTELKSSDRGRIDIIGRRYEEALQEMFTYITQLIKIKYPKKLTFAILGAEGGNEFIEMNKNMLEKGMQIRIIPGTLIPEDRASLQQRALTLANAQLIDPISLYTELGISDPKGAAQRLLQWNTDPQSLFDELQSKEKAAGGRQTEANVAKAQDETERMIAGEAQPPFEEADANHVNFHTNFMEAEQFQQLDPNIQKLFLDHVRAEVQIVEEGVKKQL